MIPPAPPAEDDPLPPNYWLREPADLDPFPDELDDLRRDFDRTPAIELIITLVIRLVGIAFWLALGFAVGWWLFGSRGP